MKHGKVFTLTRPNVFLFMTFLFMVPLPTWSSGASASSSKLYSLAPITRPSCTVRNVLPLNICFAFDNSGWVSDLGPPGLKHRPGGRLGYLQMVDQIGKMCGEFPRSSLFSAVSYSTWAKVISRPVPSARHFSWGMSSIDFSTERSMHPLAGLKKCHSLISPRAPNLQKVIVLFSGGRNDTFKGGDEAIRFAARLKKEENVRILSVVIDDGVKVFSLETKAMKSIGSSYVYVDGLRAFKKSSTFVFNPLCQLSSPMTKRDGASVRLLAGLYRQADRNVWKGSGRSVIKTLSAEWSRPPLGKEVGKYVKVTVQSRTSMGLALKDVRKVVAEMSKEQSFLNHFYKAVPLKRGVDGRTVLCFFYMR